MFEPLSAVGEQRVIELRLTILEGFAEVSDGFDQLLGLLFADPQGLEHEILTSELLPRLSVGAKVKAAQRLLEWSRWREYWPFFELLPECIPVRNVLAHSVLDIFESTDKTLLFESRVAGKPKRVKILLPQLFRVQAILYHVSMDLLHLNHRLHFEYQEPDD